MLIIVLESNLFNQVHIICNIFTSKCELLLLVRNIQLFNFLILRGNLILFFLKTLIFRCSSISPLLIFGILSFNECIQFDQLIVNTSVIISNITVVPDYTIVKFRVFILSFQIFFVVIFHCQIINFFLDSFRFSIIIVDINLHLLHFSY